MRSIRNLSAFALLAVLATACGDNGPTYPTTFEPVALEDDIATANTAMESPASTSFGAVSYDIDDALAALGGGAVALDLPALMLAEDGATPAQEVRSRMNALVAVEGRTAAAIPAAALGKTFTWDIDTDTYVMSQLTGAPANGVRFILYTIDPISGNPAEPLVQAGWVDLTRTATSSSATARVQVYGGVGQAATKVLDYSATVTESDIAASVKVAGFAKNETDSLAFFLNTSVSIASQALVLNWNTALPSRSLVTRVKQAWRTDDNDQSVIGINVMMQSANGRVDIGGTLHEATGGTLNVRVNGDLFAKMTLTNAEEQEPTITDPDGNPLTAEELALLQNIFGWVAGAFVVFLGLLAPVGTLLDAAF